MMRILEARPDRFEVCYEASVRSEFSARADRRGDLASGAAVADSPGVLERFRRGDPLRSVAHRHGEQVVHVEIGSGTQVASRGPRWRIATPRY